MTDTRRERVMDLLVKAGELPVEGRAAFLLQACGEDAELHNEVCSLLKHHSSKTIIPAGHTPAVPANSATLLPGDHGAIIRAANRQDASAMRHWFWAVVLALACLTGAASWIRGQIQQALRQDLAAELLSVLEADGRIIRELVLAEQNLADTWASHTDLRRLTERLVAINEASGPRTLAMNYCKRTHINRCWTYCSS